MRIENIYSITKMTMNDWKNAYGYAPDSTSNLLDGAMLDWIVEVTHCLKIWSSKGLCMTNGELILARANLGALVECWLKFFYCIYYEDYIRNPRTTKNGNVIEPNQMRFEDLKIFSRGILWKINDNWDIWISKVQMQRNAIHVFNYKNIGTGIEFLDDVERFEKFIQLILNRLPSSPASIIYDN